MLCCEETAGQERLPLLTLLVCNPTLSIVLPCTSKPKPDDPNFIFLVHSHIPHRTTVPGAQQDGMSSPCQLSSTNRRSRKGACLQHLQMTRDRHSGLDKVFFAVLIHVDLTRQAYPKEQTPECITDHLPQRSQFKLDLAKASCTLTVYDLHSFPSRPFQSSLTGQLVLNNVQNLEDTTTFALLSVFFVKLVYTQLTFQCDLLPPCAFNHKKESIATLPILVICRHI